MSTLLEKHAPKRVAKRRYQPLSPWFDVDCAAEKRKTRMFERRYRRTKSAEDRKDWIAQVRQLHDLYTRKQNLFWQNQVKESHGNPKKLWRTLSTILCRDQKKAGGTCADHVTAENFSSAFKAKVDMVRNSTASSPYPDFVGPGCVTRMDNFEDINTEFASRLLTQAANKNCALDPAPTWIVKRFVDELAPFVAAYVNVSFKTGSFPSNSKRAIITPVLKNPKLDRDDLNNYRPVSNLTFLSKILERSAYTQLHGYLNDSGLLPEKQSAYRRHHSTETAVIDVLSDVYEAADSGQVTLLGMLDQSSAFDVVDHQILFDRLEHVFGLTGRVLDWIKSYLSSRSMYVFFNGHASSVTSVVCGIPQGSVLGPLFFLLYTAPLLPIIEEHGFKVHAYADDLQIYAHVSPERSSDLVTRFSDCVEAVKSWMASNRLKLNPSKTEIIWLGSAGQLQRCPMTPLFIAGAWITPSSRVRNLGVIIDGALTMGAHVDKLVGICFFHLRQLRIVRRTLDVDAAHALVRALIHSRLDYCNSVLAGLPAYMFKRLQSVLNAAARLVLQLPGRQSVTIPMAEKLHWLGFPHRVTYKLCVLIYKGLHGLAPDYLSRRCVRVRDVPGRAHLRSASAGQLMVPITNRRTIGDKGFSHCGPVAWNNLPLHLRSDDCTPSLDCFKKHLKTALFKLTTQK